MSLMSSNEEFHCSECESTQFLKLEADKQVCLECGLVNTHLNQKNQADLRKRPSDDRKKELPGTFLHDIPHENALLQKWNHIAKVSDSTERNLVDALSEITRLGDELSISIKVLEKASDIYRQLLEKRHLKRCRIATLSAAATYISCRLLNYPITLGDIVKTSGFNKKEIGKSYRFLIKELNIKVGRENHIILKQPSKNFSKNDMIITKKILNSAKENRITIGKNPNSITASASYIAAQLTGSTITQRELSEIYHVTQTTIRNRYKELFAELKFTVLL